MLVAERRGTTLRLIGVFSLKPIRFADFIAAAAVQPCGKN